MSNVLIRNASTVKHLLGLDSDDMVTIHVAIENNRIASISEQPIEGQFDRVIEANGLFLSPGLVDPQVHFREPGSDYKEDIESGSKAAVKGGFTSVISMPNTSPTADNPEVIAFMLNRSKEAGICKVYPTGALSMGLAGQTLTDFAALKEAGVVAITDDGKGVQDDELFLKALKRARQLNLPVLDHSEDESLSDGGAIHEGDISRQFGVKGIKASSESVHVERGCRMSGETGAHYHVLHVSTRASIDAVRAAKAKGIPVTAEVSPHHLLLCDDDIRVREDNSLDANWKMNPPLRSRADKEACQQALLDGTIDAIATDHAPHSPTEKAQPIELAPFGIIGLETAFPLIYSHFVKTGQLPLATCVDLMSKQAGGLFNLACGRIQVGAAADLCLFDLETACVIDAAFFASKSTNSPFIGETLYGQTRMTMTEGHIVYDLINTESSNPQQMSPVNLAPRTSIEQVEEGQQLAPKFDSDGLIACITTAVESGEVLMLGYMNAEALEQTIITGEAHYWSRSRGVLWHKGATSGLVQRVVEMRVDDDQDAIWLRVTVAESGASCHVGYRSCFYRRVPVAAERHDSDALVFVEHEKPFDPVDVYGDAPNPTQL